MNCQYCGREDVQLKNPCRGCGNVAKEPEWTRGEPFEHKGYIVWPLRHILNDFVEFCFYKGRYLEGKHTVSREALMRQEGYHEGVDIFPQIFEEWHEEKVLEGEMRQRLGYLLMRIAFWLLEPYRVTYEFDED